VSHHLYMSARSRFVLPVIAAAALAITRAVAGALRRLRRHRPRSMRPRS